MLGVSVWLALLFYFRKYFHLTFLMPDDPWRVKLYLWWKRNSSISKKNIILIDNFFLRLFAKNILCVGSEIGRLPPQFGDAAKIATNILNSGFEYDSGKMLFNRFKSVVSYDTTEMPIYSMATVNNADKLALYDSLDADVLQSYMEYSLASLIYYCLKEGACSEQSSRMTAMDNSSKNAGMFLGCAVWSEPIWKKVKSWWQILNTTALMYIPNRPSICNLHQLEVPPNEYETAPYFIYLSQNLTLDFLLITVFLPVFAWSAVQNETILWAHHAKTGKNR